MNGKFHGQGTYKFFEDQKVYTGAFEDNTMHGQGTMEYADGSKYEGQWVHGKKCGTGTRFFPNGDHYIGQFKDNQMNGAGVYYSITQQNKRQGEWLNGKRVAWLTAP